MAEFKVAALYQYIYILCSAYFYTGVVVLRFA
jgi:hypothetical protein